MNGILLTYLEMAITINVYKKSRDFTNIFISESFTSRVDLFPCHLFGIRNDKYVCEYSNFSNWKRNNEWRKLR